MLTFNAVSALHTAWKIAVKLGAAYQGAYLTGFSIKDWYQACGLDENGVLYDGLFADEDAKRSRSKRKVGSKR